MLKLPILGLELLVLCGQVDGVLQDVSQQVAMTVLCGPGLLFPQLLPGSEYLYPHSQKPVDQPALGAPAHGMPSFPTDLQHVACPSSGSLHVQVVESRQVLLCSVPLLLQGF